MFRRAGILKSILLGYKCWLKDNRLWSLTLVKITLTLSPFGLGTVTYPLKGNNSFLRNCVGKLWVNTILGKVVVCTLTFFYYTWRVGFCYLGISAGMIGCEGWEMIVGFCYLGISAGMIGCEGWEMIVGFC